MPGTRKLGRASDHRMAMLRGLVTYLFEYGHVETTATRAKEVRSLAEKMITIAKEPTLANRRRVQAFLTKGYRSETERNEAKLQAERKANNELKENEKEIIPTGASITKKLFDEIAPQYKERNGGYTRIILAGPRRGDAAEMAIIELIVEEKKTKKTAKPAARAGRGSRSARVKKSEEVADSATEDVTSVEEAAEEAAVESVTE